jgi:DNA-binding winged helix-turn-helix (wHTH) protein
MPLSESCYRFDEVVLDSLNLRVTVAGSVREMEPKSFRLLKFLIENRQRVVAKHEILSVVWEGVAVTDNALARAIAQIRKALGDDPKQPRYIETVPTIGYRFVGRIHELAEAPIAPPALVPVPSGRHRRVGFKVLVPATVTVLAFLAAGYFYFHRTFRRTPKLTDKDRIVLADFVNTTGDPVFDGTLRQGLAVQLEQSPFLSLASDERVRKALRLMGRRPDTRLTPELAREVCQRTAGAAVLEGSVARLGSQYVLGLLAKNCLTGEVLDQEQVQAARKEDVLRSLSQIAVRFRSRVGESLTTVEKHDTPLAEATTPSLEALKEYSTGWRVLSS